MKFAIIAAGEGSRLTQEGIKQPKPLVKINGEAMIERLMRIFKNNGAEEIIVIVNQMHKQTEQFVRQMMRENKYNIQLIVKTTQSSMHSFYEISKYIDNEPFCLTTVDTIFREEEFEQYICQFKTTSADGAMAVTDYIDDEKPLYVATDEILNITGFHDANEGDKYISGGIYCLKPQTINTLQRCIKEGKSRMRNYQRALIEDGWKLKAVPFSKILDVDHAEDIIKAENFLKVVSNNLQ